MLLVLAGIGIERGDNGDPLGRCPLQCIHHDQLFHRPLVDRSRMALNHKGIAAAYRFLEPHIDLGVGVGDRASRHELDVHERGYLVSKLGVRPPGEEHEVLLVRAFEAAHDGSFCSSAASAARAVLVSARLRATQPGTLRCRLRLTASSPGPTLPVIVEPAAMYAPSATSTGAASTELLPTKEYAPT